MGLLEYNTQKRLFTPHAYVKDIPDAPTQLTANNYHKERDFKLEVLEWLTNGKPKLFRSPTEGNYIVRLMNTSLTPNDTLGRMLHTFSCTAYEIAECNIMNLQSDNYQFISKNIVNISNNSMLFETHSNQENIKGEFYYIKISGNPHSQINLKFKNNTEYTQMYLGNNGIYELTPKELVDNPIIEI
jgi:hypothetical protein